MSLPVVVVDARMVGPIPHGFSRYVTQMARGLLSALKKSTPAYRVIFLVGAKTPPEFFGGFETVRVGAPFLNPIEMAEIPSVLKKVGASLYHSPTFSSLLTWPKLPCPWIVTIHDLNHLSYGGVKERLYYERVLKTFARKAAKVLTVSEFSRGEIAHWTGIPASEIAVVHNSIDPESFHPVTVDEAAPVLAKYKLEKGKYFLSLSNPKPHKNIPLLVRAYAGYRAKKGSGAWPLVLSLSAGAFTEDGVRCVGGIADSDARVLISSAGAVVFPSLYEGFGLPPVEAAALGVPVVVSDIAPHREGLADLKPGEASWVDPRDIGGWVTALEEAASAKLTPPSPESRMRLIARFDPSVMGRDMDRIYRAVLGISP